MSRNNPDRLPPALNVLPPLVRSSKIPESILKTASRSPSSDGNRSRSAYRRQDGPPASRGRRGASQPLYDETRASRPGPSIRPQEWSRPREERPDSSRWRTNPGSGDHQWTTSRYMDPPQTRERSHSEFDGRRRQTISGRDAYQPEYRSRSQDDQRDKAWFSTSRSMRDAYPMMIPRPHQSGNELLEPPTVSYPPVTRSSGATLSGSSQGIGASGSMYYSFTTKEYNQSPRRER